MPIKQAITEVEYLQAYQVESDSNIEQVCF